MQPSSTGAGWRLHLPRERLQQLPKLQEEAPPPAVSQQEARSMLLWWCREEGEPSNKLLPRQAAGCCAGAKLGAEALLQRC